LGTLCARADRIGLEGTSCLLDGLRKNLSFSFFVVCVLVCPASEVVVLAEQQLQGLGDFFLVVATREWHRVFPASGVRLSISTVVINQVAAKGQHLSPIPGACALRHQQSQIAV
jgi:hypothetical protein